MVRCRTVPYGTIPYRYTLPRFNGTVRYGTVPQRAVFKLIPYMRVARPCVPRNFRYSTCIRTISPKRTNAPKKRNIRCCELAGSSLTNSVHEKFTNYSRQNPFLPNPANTIHEQFANCSPKPLFCLPGEHCS